MKATILTTFQGQSYTISKFLVNDIYVCDVLEDKVRKGAKIAGRTAIPAGTYDIMIDYSERFKKLMPHIMNVPNFSGIRIHAGNTEFDTEGCPLLGLNTVVGKLTNSKIMFTLFFNMLSKAIKNGEKCTIEIIRLNK